MSETQTETKPNPEAAPAPVAGTPAASETKPAPAPAAPAAENKTPGTEAAPKMTGADFFKQREAKREKKAQERVVELEKELEKMRSQIQPEKAAPKAEPKPDLLEDHEKWAEQVRKDSAEEALRAVEHRQAEAKAQQEHNQATEKAYDLLLTRSHIKEDPKAADEIADILAKKYDGLAKYGGGGDPVNAARLAYIDWCQQKGVVPDLDGIPKPAMQLTAGRATSGVPPTAPGSGKRVFAKGEIKKYLDEVPAGSAEWRRRLDETDEAYKEGRVQR